MDSSWKNKVYDKYWQNDVRSYNYASKIYRLTPLQEIMKMKCRFRKGQWVVYPMGFFTKNVVPFKAKVASRFKSKFGDMIQLDRPIPGYPESTAYHHSWFITPNEYVAGVLTEVDHSNIWFNLYRKDRLPISLNRIIRHG